MNTTHLLGKINAVIRDANEVKNYIISENQAIQSEPHDVDKFYPDNDEPKPEQWKEGDYAVGRGEILQVTEIDGKSDYSVRVINVKGKTNSWIPQALRRPTDDDWWVDFGNGVKGMFEDTGDGSENPIRLNYDDGEQVDYEWLPEKVAKALADKRAFIKPKE